jgi:hypothetical protein
MEMNGNCRFTSGGIQCAGNRLHSMIEQPGHSGQLKILKQEMTMLKTISAALLATSLIAAPALAAGTKSTATAPAQTTESKADATTGAKTDLKTGAATTTKSKPLNANAKMGKRHKKHISHLRHHKQHKVAALKTRSHAKIQAKAPVKSSAKVSFKQAQPSSKRG